MTLLRRACRIQRVTAADPPPDLRELRPYQAEGVRWLRARAAAGRGAMLADEMGLGKTCQTLRALPRRARAIVVCPASVALVWAEEAERWRPDLRTAPFARRAPAEGEIAISSYDALPALRRGALVDDDLSRATLVLDEAHRAKGGGAARTRKVRSLVEQCAVTWGLTGTPMAGTPDDLRGVLESLGLFSEAFPGGQEEYDGLCQARRQTTRSGRVLSTWGEISPEIARRLRRVMLRRTRAGCLDLPAEQWVDVPCAAPADLRDHLDRMTEAWDAYDPAELPPFELYSAATAALARSRAGAARELAAEVARERPVLVFSAHLGPVGEVASLPEATRITGAETDAERAAAVADFRSGRRRILATTRAGGEGLNLPEAGAAILVDEDWTPSVTDQFLARARGARAWGGLLVYRMASDHPLDRRIRQVLDEKRSRIARAVDGLD